MIAVSKISEGIKKKLGSFYSTDAHSTTDYVRYINSAARYIVTKKNFPFNKYSFSVTTNTTDKEFDIPYQIETFFVLTESGDEIDLYNFENYYRQKDKTQSLGVFENKLLANIAGTFTLFYRGFVKTIENLEGSIDMPEHFLDLMVLVGTYYGFMDVKAFDKANFVKGIMDGLIKDLATRQSDKLPLQTKRLNTSNNNVR